MVLYVDLERMDVSSITAYIYRANVDENVGESASFTYSNQIEDFLIKARSKG